MSDDYFVSNYILAKSFNRKHNRKLKSKKQFIPECLIKLGTNQILKPNLNRYKNWKFKDELLELIQSDPEYGQIKRSRDKLEFLIYKSDSKEVEEIIIFSKVAIEKRQDRVNLKTGQKFGHTTYKKTYDKHLFKTFKQRTKRQIILDEDFVVNKPNALIEKSNSLSDRFISSLRYLITDIKNNGQVQFQIFDGTNSSTDIKNLNQLKHLIHGDQNFKKIINQNFECPICLSQSNFQIVLNKCQHACCFECWKNYINSANALNDLKCCYFDCEEELESNFLKLFLSKSQYRKYLEINVKKKLNFHNYISCPNNCGNIYLKNEIKFLTCQCGFKFCTDCNLESHYPISCEEFNFYVNDILKESENSVVTHGKFCPACRNFIEKDGGCTHMTCLCGHYFCWDCLQNLRSSHTKCEPIKEFEMIFKNWEVKALKLSLNLYQYRALVLEKLEKNLDSREVFIKKIFKDVSSKALCIKMVEKFKCEKGNFNFCLDSIIKKIFELVRMASRVVEYMYARFIFQKLNDIKSSILEKYILKKLENLCKLFNLMFMFIQKEKSIFQLLKLVNICNQIIKLFQMLK